MKRATLLILIMLLLYSNTALTTEASYRISGIVGQENHWLFAVIEDSAGSCRIYTKGDKLGNWSIVDITPKGVLVDAAGEIRLLLLEGSAFISRGDESADINPGFSALSASSARPVTGKLSQQELQYAVNNVAKELERDKKKPLEPQVLNAILGFPMESRITAVSDTPVRNTREALNMVQTALNSNKPLDFILSGDGENTKIYFMPYQESAPHPHE